MYNYGKRQKFPILSNIITYIYGMKILVIEDEAQLLRNIKESLEKEKFLVETASDYQTAIDKVLFYEYDCILLDIMLPNGNGLNILSALKKEGKSENVIIISAKDSIDDKLKGLELGAVLDLKERLFLVKGQNIPLNRKEFDLLNYFLLNKNRLVTKSALAEHVWGDNADDADNFDFVYYQIKNLRKKLQSADAEIEIESIYGIGYKLVEI